MREVTIAKHKICVYESIEDLPIVRYNRYTKFCMLESNIGSSFDAYSRHIERIARYIGNDDKVNAGKELDNLRQSLFFGLNETDLESMSFACLIYSIDGKIRDDLTDNGLRATLDLIKHYTTKHTLSEILSESKKKISEEVEVYFPAMVDTATGKEYYTRLKKRSLLILDDIINRTKSHATEIDRLTATMITSSKPLSFSGDNNAELKHDTNFEQTCITISKELHTNAKHMTVIEYYNALDYLNKLSKEQKKRHKRV